MLNASPVYRAATAAILTLMLGLAASPAEAKLRTRSVDYRAGDKSLQGYLAYDDAGPAKRPGVLIVHDWIGVGDYVKKRAEQVAQLGYVAFVADIYGKGVLAKDHDEAAKLAGPYFQDRALLRTRVSAGLATLISQPQVETGKLAAMGYCFGGMAALELARSGAALKGVVSFHGALGTPTPADAKFIKGAILALNGADDPHVPRAQVLAFEDEMTAAKVDWTVINYGGVMHAFTVPSANMPDKGLRYDEAADRRSWATMRAFFSERLGS